MTGLVLKKATKKQECMGLTCENIPYIKMMEQKLLQADYHHFRSWAAHKGAIELIEDIESWLFAFDKAYEMYERQFGNRVKVFKEMARDK